MRFKEIDIVEGQTQSGIFQLPNQIKTLDDIVDLQKILVAYQFLTPDQITGKLDATTQSAISKAHQEVEMQPSEIPDPEFISRVNRSLTVAPEINQIMNNISGLMKTAMFSDGDVNVTYGASGGQNQSNRGQGAMRTQPKNQYDDQIASIDEPNQFSQPNTTYQSEPNNNAYDQFRTDKVTPSKTASKLDPALVAKIEEVAGKLGITPDTLMQIINMESGGTFSPSVPSGKGGTHFGLIQFGREAAKALGVSLNQLRRMSAIQQMDYVYKYYKIVGVQPGMTVGDVYMLTFLPIAKDWPNNTILGRKGDNSTIGGHSKHNIWHSNPSFSKNKRHSSDYFTKQDVITTINQHKLT